MIVLGDFNNDTQSSDSSRKMKRIMLKFNLQHVIHVPTRATLNAETCLDLMTDHKAVICNS